MRWFVFVFLILVSLACGTRTLYLVWQTDVFWEIFALGFVASLSANAAKVVLQMSR